MSKKPIGPVRVVLSFLILVASLVSSVAPFKAERVSAVSVAARIEAAPWTPWVSVSNFTPDETVTLSVDIGGNGTTDFTSSQQVPPSGSLSFNVGTTPVGYGTVISAVSGSNNKTLMIPEIRVEYVDATTNVVSGVGPANSSVLLTIQQAGPPLASAVVSTDALGLWSHDFSAEYDIENGRQVAAEWSDTDGDIARSFWSAVVPSIAAGYSQIGANSLSVRWFSPGTSVRMRVDYANNGGPFDGFDLDETAVTTNQFGFGFNIGGFDLLHPGDRIVAEGGGWQKELLTTSLRIEKADQTTDVVGGVAVSGDDVTVGIQPLGGGGPNVASVAVVASEDGRWLADFDGLYDLAPNQIVSASVQDGDGDETFSTWRAVSPFFRAGITDGPPNQVMVANFSKGTLVRLMVDSGNDGTTDIDLEKTIGQMFGDVFSLGGTGILRAGDLITVAGGGWTKSSLLALVGVDSVNYVSDVVAGTSSPGTSIVVEVSTPPGEPGGPPVASKLVTTGTDGKWSANFSGEYDIVIDQQVSGLVVDSDGDMTEAVGFAREIVWPKSGFELPILNSPFINFQKSGSTVPIKFSLGVFRGLDIFVNGLPESSVVSCGFDVESPGGDPIVTTGKTQLSYNSVMELYELKWRTSRDWKGTCRQLVLSFADGTFLRANFKFG
jgi:hypothetical protein